jgi:hypothetical protein
MKTRRRRRGLFVLSRDLCRIDFDYTLHVLGFYSDNYQILSNLGRGKFFNGVRVYTNKELALKFLYISTDNRWRSVVPLISPW